MRHVSEGIASPDKEDDAAMISTANIHLTRDDAMALIERLSAVVDEAVAGARGREEEPDRLPFTIRVDVFQLPEDGDGR